MAIKDDRLKKASVPPEAEVNAKTKRIRKVHSYTKYSGLAYQIFGLLGVTIFLGLKADAYFGNKSQYITAFSSIIVLVAFFYKLNITLNKKP